MTININEVNIGDFCWFKRSYESKIYTGEIKNIYESETAVCIMAHPPLGGFYTISCHDSEL